MTAIVIVSGCPGSGKTTLSHALAGRLPMGLHIPSDVFYGFPADPIDPTRKESQQQNETVMRALAGAARAFALGRYSVVLDGVIGPWFLPELCRALGADLEVAYLVLRAPEAVALRRVRGREGAGASAAVTQMVAAFASLGPYAAHAIDTHERTPESILEQVLAGLADRRFVLRPPAKGPR